VLRKYFNDTAAISRNVIRWAQSILPGDHMDPRNTPTDGDTRQSPRSPLPGEKKLLLITLSSDFQSVLCR
jgi:hypothetical protein